LEALHYKGDHVKADIVVSASADPHAYAVEVRARTSTRHRVTVSLTYLHELGIGDVPAADVVREAFVFLLEREPNTSVLTQFDLREIERYFPEFRQQISQRLRG